MANFVRVDIDAEAPCDLAHETCRVASIEIQTLGQLGLDRLERDIDVGSRRQVEQLVTQGGRKLSGKVLSFLGSDSADEQRGYDLEGEQRTIRFAESQIPLQSCLETRQCFLATA